MDITYDNGDLVRFGNLIWTTRSFRVDDIDIDGCPAIIGISAEWDNQQSRHLVREVRVSPRKLRGAVTGTLLRTVPVAEASMIAASNALMESGKTTDGSLKTVLKYAQKNGKQMGADGPTSETLKWVALIYSIGDLIGDAPVVNVREIFGVPPRTATHWVKLARERGHFDE